MRTVLEAWTARELLAVLEALQTANALPKTRQKLVDAVVELAFERQSESAPGENAGGLLH